MLHEVRPTIDAQDGRVSPGGEWIYSERDGGWVRVGTQSGQTIGGGATVAGGDTEGGIEFTLASLLEDLGFAGDASAEDIIGAQFQDAEKFGGLLEPLLKRTASAIQGLPGLSSELTGQAEGRLSLGQASVGQRFGSARQGLQAGALGQARGLRTRQAASGFAGSGALNRAGAQGRRQTQQQFQSLLGQRKQSLAGLQGIFGQDVFNIGQRIEGLRGGILGGLQTGIQNLLNSLLGRGAELIGGGGSGSGGTTGGISIGATVGESKIDATFPK